MNNTILILNYMYRSVKINALKVLDVKFSSYIYVYDIVSTITGLHEVT